MLWKDHHPAGTGALLSLDHSSRLAAHSLWVPGQPGHPNEACRDWHVPNKNERESGHSLAPAGKEVVLLQD